MMMMDSVRAFCQSAQSGVRAFSTSVSSNARAYKSVVNRQLKQKPEYKVGDARPNKLWVPKEVSKYPEYPYGEARIFRRADRGLYGGQVITFGNKISEMRNHNRRTWLPNVVVKTLWSAALNRMIRMRLTARVLRTITKEGGLDNYVTKDKAARVKELGIFGWHLRYDVLRARDAAARPPAYEVVKRDDGSEAKVFFRGEYRGAPIQLAVGKRKLLETLYPAVKQNTVGELKFGQFNVPRAANSIEEILKECEALNVDLSGCTV